MSEYKIISPKTLELYLRADIVGVVVDDLLQGVLPAPGEEVTVLMSVVLRGHERRLK